ncbi:uncharacterized protein LOC131323777 [Rhododendron vialii]|uniref:uncharacterized protein LOC131323777 n=1 Tax=Rhododendron vialii TaxID=182163 RepID=UPI0026601435|nr:uncharacterized protein LOC131323777 [Rhododendron vialii]
MTDSQTRYLPMEKLALALVSAKMSLLPYFQSHRIVVLTEFPLKAVLRKTDTSSRILKFSQDLANFDIQFEPRTAIKGQALADLFVELTPGLQDEANALATAAEEARIQDEKVSKETCSHSMEPLRARYTLGQKKPKRQWRLFSGDAWRMTVDGASNVHGASAGIVLVSPNSIHIFCDSQLIVGHLNDDYQAKDLAEWKWNGSLGSTMHADALAGLASIYRTSGSRIIVFDKVATPSFEQPCQLVMAISLGPSQLDPVIDYLKNQVLPPNKRDAYKLRCRAANFFLDPNDNLYRWTFTGPDLLVDHEDHVKTVLEELHSGSCGAHSGGRSLAQRVLTQGYWWPKMVKQSKEYVKRFGKMPKAPRGFEYMLTATDLFTKWIEASPLVKTTASDVERFIWKHIISRFGVPYAILSDNGS